MSLQIDAVILAGGMSRRMGGDDKGLVDLLDKPMIKHVIDRIKPQVNQIMINANRNQTHYANLGYPVFSDENVEYLGPLAGMCTAISKTQANYLLVVPCDCPLLPLNLVKRMLTQMGKTQAELAVASDGTREQPVILLLKPHLQSSIKEYLDSGERKINSWYVKHNYAVTEFLDQKNAFINVNTPEQKQLVAIAIAK